jgi:hypothetical protein
MAGRPAPNRHPTTPPATPETCPSGEDTPNQPRTQDATDNPNRPKDHQQQAGLSTPPRICETVTDHKGRLFLSR